MFDRSTLFVSNLPYTATSTDLNTLFSDIAPVRSAFVVLEHETGASKGVGYVSFAIPEDAKAAFDSISADGIALDDRKLRIEWAANKVCSVCPSLQEWLSNIHSSQVVQKEETKPLPLLPPHPQKLKAFLGPRLTCLLLYGIPLPFVLLSSLAFPLWIQMVYGRKFANTRVLKKCSGL
jgi:RNA recognition motif-containing protein